jgi:hypothetical protein
MPLLGTPVICTASGIRQEAVMAQYTAALTTANIGLLDVLLAPSDPAKALRLAALGVVVGAASILRLASVTASALTVTGVNTTTDVITASANHGRNTGDIVVLGGTTAPAGSVLNTPYFLRSTGSADITLHPSALDAASNTNRLDLTTAGTAVTIAFFGRLLVRNPFSANSGLSHPVALDGSFLAQLPVGASLAAWADVAVDFMRFSVYEV